MLHHSDPARLGLPASFLFFPLKGREQDREETRTCPRAEHDLEVRRRRFGSLHANHPAFVSNHPSDPF